MGCFTDKSRSKRVHGGACEGDCDIAQGSVKVSCYTDCGGASTDFIYSIVNSPHAEISSGDVLL